MAIQVTKYEIKDGKIRKAKTKETKSGAAETTPDAEKNKPAGTSNGNAGKQGA